MKRGVIRESRDEEVSGGVMGCLRAKQEANEVWQVKDKVWTI